jgi:hypothetical protein
MAQALEVVKADDVADVLGVGVVVGKPPSLEFLGVEEDDPRIDSREAWWVVLGLWINTFACLGILYSNGVFTIPYTKEVRDERACGRAGGRSGGLFSLFHHHHFHFESC